MVNGTLQWGTSSTSSHHRSKMRWRGAAATPNGGNTEFSNELMVILSELVGRQVVVHGAINDRRETGVRKASNREA